VFVRFAVAAVALANASTPTSVGRLNAVAPNVLVDTCGGRDAWEEPAPPVHVHGDTFYVGTCGISSILLVSPAGLILIDGGTEKNAKFIAANIERLGYRMRDVKFILNSHEHYDHTGGIKELQGLTGAKVVALAASRPILEAGHSFRDDPQLELLKSFPAFHVDRVIRDGGTVTLGKLKLTAHSTPAHSPGSTTWTWQSCEQNKCIGIAYADSVTAPVDKDYHFLDHPEHVAEYRAALRKIAGLRCDLLMTPHPPVSKFFDRLSGKASLIDNKACAAYAQFGAANLEKQLESEQAAAKK
jgi:metallo-beta-lactamase class B